MSLKIVLSNWIQTSWVIRERLLVGRVEEKNMVDDAGKPSRGITRRVLTKVDSNGLPLPFFALLSLLLHFIIGITLMRVVNN